MAAISPLKANRAKLENVRGCADEGIHLSHIELSVSTLLELLRSHKNTPPCLIKSLRQRCGWKLRGQA